MRFIWESNYRPILRAVETEQKPRLKTGSGLNLLVEAVIAKVTETCKVFRIETDDGVFIGAGIVDYANPVLAVPYLRLRHPSVAALATIESQLKQKALDYAPLHR